MTPDFILSHNSNPRPVSRLCLGSQDQSATIESGDYGRLVRVSHTVLRGSGETTIKDDEHRVSKSHDYLASREFVQTSTVLVCATFNGFG